MTFPWSHHYPDPQQQELQERHYMNVTSGCSPTTMAEKTTSDRAGGRMEAPRWEAGWRLPGEEAGWRLPGGRQQGGSKQVAPFMWAGTQSTLSS